MTGDLVVQLAGGTYSLTSPLLFGAADSGTGGYVVRYQAAPGSTPVISGARTITSWSVRDATKNIWQATVPVGFASRQLYVDGVRARLAARRTSDVLGTLTTTLTGYTASNPAIAGWTNIQDVEFVYPAGGYDPTPGAVQSYTPWSMSECPVASVSGAAITLQQACFLNARGSYQTDNMVPGKYPGPWIQFITQPTYVQNNYALLSQPGQFYLDSAAGKVYYVPRAGENLATQSVVMPQVQSLLQATGTSASPVHDLQFVGLTFQYASWVPDAALGIVDIQGNVLENRANFQRLDPAQLTMIPANVAFSHAQRILFQGNTLCHLGGAGVSFTGGGSFNTVLGNVVTDVSSTGIQISDGIGLTAAANGYESNALVSDNYVHDVGNEYLGGDGIFAGWVQHTTISHNEVSDLAHQGIALGWGWENANSMVDNHIDYNYVHDIATSSLADGGAIYVNGEQGGVPASTMTYNYVSGDPHVYGALYLDARSSHWLTQFNVVEHVANATSGWLYMQNIASDTPSRPSTTMFNFVSNNYTDTTAQVAAPLGLDPSNYVGNNFLGLTSWPTAAQSIMSSAGLEPTYAGIRGGASIVNLSYRSLDYASTNASSAPNGNDGDATTTWASASGDLGPWWETDLGAQHSLTKISVLTRQDTDQPSAQSSFQIWVSNVANLTTGYTVACAQGATALPYRETFTCTLPSGPWRYVGVMKPDGAPFSLGEVRIYGQL